MFIIIINIIVTIIITTITTITIMKVGHNLGMHHDSTAGCARDGFIMSPSRGTKGFDQLLSLSLHHYYDDHDNHDNQGSPSGHRAVSERSERIQTSNVSTTIPLGPLSHLISRFIFVVVFIVLIVFIFVNISFIVCIFNIKCLHGNFAGAA